MARLVLALALLSLLSLPGLSQPSPQKPAENEPKQSKEELAKQALSRARDAQKEAQGRADGAIKNLEAFVRDLDDRLNAKKVAADLEESAQTDVEKRAEDAEKTFQSRLATLAKSGSGGDSKAVAAAAQKAKRAARDVEHLAGNHMAKAVRGQFKHVQKAQREEARTLAREAHEGARAAVKAAHALEYAERRAGVKEDSYKKALDRNAHIGRCMEDRTQELEDQAEDKIDRYLDTLEARSEVLEDDARGEAAKQLEAERRAVRWTKRQAGEEAEKVRATAEKAAAKAKAKAAFAAVDPTQVAHPAQDDTKAAVGTDGANAGGASAGGSASSVGRSIALTAARPVPLLGAAWLLVFAAPAVAFPTALRMRRTVREAPLLG